MLERLVAPAAKDVLDIGCGGGALVRALAARGARVVGLEISAEQLAPALAHPSAALEATAPEATTPEATRARYLLGTAQALPLGNASIDIAVFMRSLHHVPPPELQSALREARRVLRPGGVVYVAEPLAEGDYYALTALVEDELEVRRAADDALTRASQAGLERATTIQYEVRVCIAGLDALRKRMVSANPARAASFDARQQELAEAFARLGEPGADPGERCFVQPMRADVLRAASA
ncbi:MAG TPA: class I SAM-dependent methyltransferase [Solirubrobacteraceae bacterium]|jgi:hypothetical protein|nr:class I SAM-dependent methyltransferase [Solirubrobacteraceae bacterium]